MPCLKKFGSLGAVVGRFRRGNDQRVVVGELFDRDRKLDVAGSAAGAGMPPV
jgi:hypothetical protein